jgi:hypothetical protein
MPIFWGERTTPAGAKLPYTEIRVGDIVLRFGGRPGAKLAEAVRHLEERSALDTASRGGKIRRPAEKLRGPQKPKKGKR